MCDDRSLFITIADPSSFSSTDKLITVMSKDSCSKNIAISKCYTRGSTIYLNVCFFLWFPPAGEHCEVNASSGRCVPGVCKNGGRCVNRLAGGFMCECPPGEYEKPYCEMTTRSFPGQSFITFRGLRQRFHFTVSFTWVLSFLKVWIFWDLCCCCWV